MTEPFDPCLYDNIDAYFDERTPPAEAELVAEPDATPEVPAYPADRRLAGNLKSTPDDIVGNKPVGDSTGTDTWSKLAAWAKEQAGHYGRVVASEKDKRNAALAKAKREVAEQNRLIDAQNRAARFAANQANWTKRLQVLDKDADYLVDASNRMVDYISRAQRLKDEGGNIGTVDDILAGADDIEAVFVPQTNAAGEVTGYDMVMGDRMRKALVRNQLQARKVKEMVGSTAAVLSIAGQFTAGVGAQIFGGGAQVLGQQIKNDDAVAFFNEKGAEIEQMYKSYENFDRDVLTPVSAAVDTYKDTLRKLEKGANPGDLVNGIERMTRELEQSFDVGALKGALNTVKAAGDAANNVMKGLVKAQQVMRAATQILAAVQTMVLAVCQLVPAVIQMVKYFMQMLPLMVFLMIMSLLEGLLPKNWHFKWPKVPGLDLLKTWKGLMNTLAGFGDTLAGCTGALGGNPDEMLASLQGGMDAVKNFDPLAAVGIKLPNLQDVSPSNVIAEAWQSSKSVVAGRPNRVAATPDVAGLISRIFGSAATIGSLMSGFGFGKSELDKSDMAKRVPNPEDPGAGKVEVGADSFKHFFNMIAVGAELMAIAQTAAQNAKAMTNAGKAMSAIGPGATEDAGRDAAKAIIKSCQVGAMTANGVMNEHLDDDSLSPAAQFHFMCKQLAGDELHDEAALNPAGPEGDTAVGEAAIVDRVKAVLNAGAGQPHSPAKIAEKNKGGASGTAQSPAVEDVIENLPFTGVPDGFYEDTYRMFLQNYRDPSFQFSGEDLRDLPMLLLLQDPTQKALFDKLKSAEATIAGITANPERLAAHLGVLQKANFQGIANGSPYTYLAFGVTVTDGQRLTLLVEQFLRHAYDIRAVAGWMQDLVNVDFEIPLPQDLSNFDSFDERDAAFESDLYAQANRDDLSSVVLLMRHHADRYGHAMGYEYFVMLAIQTLMTRMRNMIDAGATPEDVAAVSAIARDMSDLLTHKGPIQGVLAGLAEVED